MPTVIKCKDCGHWSSDHYLRVDGLIFCRICLANSPMPSKVPDCSQEALAIPFD